MESGLEVNQEAGSPTVRTGLDCEWIQVYWGATLYYGLLLYKSGDVPAAASA